MPTYDEVNTMFGQYGCKLYTSEDEYNTVRVKSKMLMKFKASCEHDNTVTLTNFLAKKTGVLCKSCVHMNTAKLLKDKHRNESKDAPTHSILEYEGFKLFKEAISDEFDMINTYEGCNADILIKPKYLTNDKWMFLQMKCTKQSVHGLYTFAIMNKNYDNCELICICLDEAKIWALDHTCGIGKNKINIGLTKKSEYFKYQLPLELLIEKLHITFCTAKRFCSKYGNTPTTIVCQQEQLYNRFLEKNMPYLMIEYPDIQATKTDAFINKNNIQFKVASIRRGRIDTYVAFMSIRVNKTKHYKKGDNDFYWIWLKNDFVNFHIFPEDVLIQKKFILSGDMTTALHGISITKNNWTQCYKYSVEDPDIENMLMKLFNKLPA
jgi:hypothetical protein